MDDTEITRFTTLWASAQPSLFAFISASITNFADAEDVLQQVAAASVRKFADFDASRPFVGWAIGIARFEILRHLRDKAADRHEFVAESIGQIADAFEAIAPELDDRRRALADCLKHVRGTSHEVLIRMYGEGMKTRAIAKVLRLSAGNVSVILNRTYRKLRDCIDAKLAAEGAS